MFIKKLTLISVGLVLLLTISSCAQAYDRRMGDFRLTFNGSSPWFAGDNVFAPGETKIKKFKVFNYGSDSSNLFFISSAGGDGGFDSKFSISIVKDGDLIFKKLLSDISARPNSQEVIGNISSNSSSNYQFKVRLKKQLDNNYQGQQTSKFNFLLGYGELGPEPETIISVFGSVTEGEVAASQQGVSEEIVHQDQTTAKELIGEKNKQQVAGEEDIFFGFSGYYWLIFSLILLIITLIIYRYWLENRSG